MDKSLDEPRLMKKPLWLRSRDHPKQKNQKKSISLSWLTECRKGFPFLNRHYNHVRLIAKRTQPDGTSPSLLCCTVWETKMTQTCVNSWEKHPCFTKVIKITLKYPTVGYAQNRSVFPGREGHCQTELDLQPTHIKAALSKPPFSPLSFPVLTGNRRW